ncbi:hypothetical protein BO71DRAFT_419764 [Aspergillus ellipticus CBS 707.79]|uniref:Uncharacterized protein n=1 Tax=Aspergillus ellipticus CBS 707.79 TaxID=1448320 RepID=A0A319D8Z0_9EURO|nr:hypothetical protein BO71DRAFT_419764 [Aspergillus ellipticus CBS 707.79]
MALPLPVVIPQQRPGSKSRGFIAAYAPSLEACDIDQLTFLQFIHDCNKALTGNKWLAGVQVVSFGVSFTPEVITMAVATAVNAAATVANTAHMHHKTNSVLNRYNEEVFGPRGLFCMIMKYDPRTLDDSPFRNTPLEQLGNIVTSKFGGNSRSQSSLQQLGSIVTTRMVGKSRSQPLQNLGNIVTAKMRGDSQSQFAPLKQLMGSSKFRDPVSGETKGPQSLPTAVAPLVYIDDRRQLKEMLGSPAMESRAVESDSSSDRVSGQGKKPASGNKAKEAIASVNDYLDRRARARYTSENEGDILNVPLTRGFTNRYLDPNHPAVNNGLMGVLSGGLITSDADKRTRAEARRVERDEKRILDQYYQEVYDIEHQNLPQGEIERQLEECDARHARSLGDLEKRKRAAAYGKRQIKNDVLYLTIVNRPSDAELAAATAQLDRNGGQYRPVAAMDI